MSRSRNKQIDEIYSQALDLTGPEREAFISSRCGDDANLRSEVVSLLDAAEAPGDLIDNNFDSLRDRLLKSVFSSDGAENLSGRKIDAWQIDKRLARGGLATVYLAHRDDGEFEQTAAFKVLRRGLDTDDLVARFRAERQFLSTLEHPSIAKIFDGGALDDGRPYLVLEYVDGVAITDYCEENNLPIRDRVVLLIAVLRALHHAHKHLVVHRDVKPSNILVTADGNISLLDFGIAKVLDPAAMPGASTMTRTGVSLLTPGYGSPEQHAGETVTTASDIYQAGLVLFELLTGRRPFSGNTELLRTDQQSPADAMRGRRAFKEISGDLDAITRKATRTEPARRYASANEMVADLRRYLDGLPVIARPDTFGYRFRKSVRRRPWLVPVVVVASLSIAAYVTTLTVYSQRLKQEEQLSAAAQQFMVDLFRSPDPYAPADADRGSNITVVEALKIGRLRIESELGDQLELKSTMLATIADVLGSLDQEDDAIRMREDALAIERELYGDESSQVLESLRFLGARYRGKEQISLADRVFDEQLAIAKRMYASDDPQLGVAEIASAINEFEKGNLDTPMELILGGIEKLRANPVGHAQMLVDALIRYAVQREIESSDSGLAALAEAQAIADTNFGADSLQAALVRIRLASTMSTFADYEGAERNFQGAIPVLEASLGPEHRNTLAALNNLGYLYHRSNEFAKAEGIHRKILARQIGKHGERYRPVADSYQNLAGAITSQGRYDESVPLHRKAYEIYKAILNDDNYVIAFPLLSIANAELQRGDPSAAEAAASEALSRFQTSAPGSFLEGVARCLVGLSLEQQGRGEEGSALVISSHPLMQGASIPEPYPGLCRLPDPRS
ncbi:MAG: tetratricopeptide repeat protein [Desulfobulbaceae bacterium]|nr:tetratricopeptide repeat protein [Desulfobulbaceae bacterium]